MTNDVVAIIQARMGSSRLPGKVILPFQGSSVIARVIAQVRHSTKISRIVVATTLDSSDDTLVDHLKHLDVPVFRGSANDVLDRYYQCAKWIAARTVVRITADCPLIDPAIIDAVIDLFASRNVMYASNIEPPTFPDGLDVEVFTREALERSWAEATLPSEREHVTQYIRKHPDLFPRCTLTSPLNLNHLRWTLDEPMDYDFLGLLSRELPVNPAPVSMEMVLKALERIPQAANLNAHITRNEGLLKSLAEDPK
jgi:spore coat polysaccharide biosynthesis protein SpsF